MNISFAAKNTNEFIHWYLPFLLIEDMYVCTMHFVNSSNSMLKIFINVSNLMMH